MFARYCERDEASSHGEEIDDDEALLRPEVLSLKGTSEFLHTQTIPVS